MQDLSYYLILLKTVKISKQRNKSKNFYSLQSLVYIVR
jgi:hypothetical protein